MCFRDLECPIATSDGLSIDPTKVKAIVDITELVCESSQQNVLDTLKEAVASTPVLRYYNLADEVTIQCDASQSGLGAALMHNGQPVAYASRALTPPETRYAQIEKNLLTIVFRSQSVRNDRPEATQP